MLKKLKIDKIFRGKNYQLKQTSNNQYQQWILLNLPKLKAKAKANANAKSKQSTST
jgi:hypothetical protein